ncbi:cytochrome bd-I oxidase subunit CydX [Janthinobacterium fluminis]|uniref:Cytochrome bd-I oxidase subunit CydX n=1 Tax=Janthinobacterium fluminis TaxID=2987524 RepID=A0ABT5K541_9BURK|nr:cytochrome bd-I oxidase subunit CydX [Janthinobacterium fluminis]MDC8760117.1 cytochrome bd-I oxidase subunit CydX [Janthinobacterium fluminis]
MWYFTWILGIGVAVALAVINVMWLESNYAFGLRDEEQTRARFERASLKEEARKR